MPAAPSSSFQPSTGLPALDVVLCGLAPGDNVVWQIQALEEYRALVGPYATAAQQQGRRLIYFRFACHPAVLDESATAEIHCPRPQDGFEAFVDQVHDVIEAAGPQTLYVFDCLSELADVWQSDRMMGNFFRLTCPRLLDLDTVTYFGIYRNTHSRIAIEMIASTTQFLLDVFACRGRHYLRPVKVRHDCAAAMNLIHAWEPGDRFRAVTDSGTVSEILAQSEWPGLEDEAIAGYWQRQFSAARAVWQHAEEDPSHLGESRAQFAVLARLLFPDDARLLEMASHYLDLGDLLAIRERMIGIGGIGGKALGMLLSRAVLRKDAPELAQRLEAHDSFYVGTVVHDTFMVWNQLWWIRRRQRSPDGFLQQLDEARARILEGHFPAETIRQFEGMLDYFGEWPFIVRSSSRLEDRYGSAFAGQYDSVFCVNQGPRETRLTALLDAVRQVYASTLTEQALRYRARRGLLDESEQMALLIMRVSGSRGARFFHPHAAGVGLSLNPYKWHPDIDIHAGVLRLVAGLGTRAVDRADDDHTRLIALNAPQLRPQTQFSDIARTSQRRMDVLDLVENRIVSGRFTDVLSDPGDFPMALFARREADDRPPFLTFDGLLEQTGFVADMRTLLASLDHAYAHAVEIEFALNLLPDSNYRINLLQCRPMQVRAQAGEQITPAADAPRLLTSAGAVIGPSRVIRPDRMVLVTAPAYAALNQRDRLLLTHIIGRINELSRDRCLMMLGPGRWGSRDPFLGIPVAFNDIRHVAALCEIVAMHEYLIPDVSLGTHFLNELIEADMLYFALFPRQSGNLFDSNALNQLPNQLPDLLPDAIKWQDTLQVFDPPPGSLILYADAEQQRVTITLESSMTP